MIPYSRQFISKKDKSYVLKALSSDFLTTGPLVKKFEEKLKKKFKSKYAVVVNSATTGLHISALALNLKENDILWTSPVSFVASSNCALYCKAKIDFVDIDELEVDIEPINEPDMKIKTESEPEHQNPTKFPGKARTLND